MSSEEKFMFFNKNYSEERMLLKECNLVDTRNMRVMQNVSILIENGKIAAIGALDTDSVDARTVSASGYTVTPGLIDAHVHLALSGKPDSHLSGENMYRAEQKAILCENLRLNLQNGITAVRDLGCRWELLDMMRELEQGSDVFTTVMACGPVCTIPDGHATFFGEIVFPQNMAAMIERLKSQGAEFVKIIGTGGNLSPRTDCFDTQYTDDEFAEMMEFVISAEMDAACHAHATAGIEQCMRYGVRSIEHGSYITEQQVHRLAQREDCFWVPTICPGRLIENLSEAASDRVARRRSMAKLAAGHGVNLVAGTDAGIGDVPHGCLPHELDEFTDAGMSPMRALHSATHLAAVLMRKEGQIGVIEPGSAADILFFNGDIESDGFSFHNPELIIKGGCLVKT